MSTWPLVGRSAELATLRGLVDAAAAGTGGAVMVAGEAGIGKSRLLQEIAERASAAEMVVLAGRAVEGGGTYRALAEALFAHLRTTRIPESEELRPYRAALRRLLPGWPGGTGADGTREGAAADEAPAELAVDPVLVLGEGVLGLLRAIGGSRGCVLRLEDLHWADEDTVALVEHLAGAVAGLPLLVAVSARDDQRSVAAPRLAAAPGMVTLRLRRLDESEVGALAAACRGGRALSSAEVAALLARSEGVPFLIEELIDSAGERPGLPPTLAGLVDARLAALPAPSPAVLAAAAVLGGEPDVGLLTRVSGHPDSVVLDALRGAVDIGLLTSAGGELRWRHALTRDAVLAGLLQPEVAALARNAAETLVQRAGPDDELRAAELFGIANNVSAIFVKLQVADRGQAIVRRVMPYWAAERIDTSPSAERSPQLESARRRC